MTRVCARTECGSALSFWISGAGAATLRTALGLAVELGYPYTLTEGLFCAMSWTCSSATPLPSSSMSPSSRSWSAAGSYREIPPAWSTAGAGLSLSCASCEEGLISCAKAVRLGSPSSAPGASRQMRPWCATLGETAHADEGLQRTGHCGPRRGLSGRCPWNARRAHMRPSAGVSSSVQSVDGAGATGYVVIDLPCARTRGGAPRFMPDVEEAELRLPST